MAQSRKKKKSAGKKSTPKRSRQKTRKIGVKRDKSLAGVEIIEYKRGRHKYRVAIVKGRKLTRELLKELRKRRVHEIITEESRQVKVEKTKTGGKVYPYNEGRDKRRRALPPGKRCVRGKNGKWHCYYEYRANRTDLKDGI